MSKSARKKQRENPKTSKKHWKKLEYEGEKALQRKSATVW